MRKIVVSSVVLICSMLFLFTFHTYVLFNSIYFILEKWMEAGQHSAIGSMFDSRARGTSHFCFPFCQFKRGSCQLLVKFVHLVLVNCLGGSVDRLTDCPDITIRAPNKRRF